MQDRFSHISAPGSLLSFLREVGLLVALLAPVRRIRNAALDSLPRQPARVLLLPARIGDRQLVEVDWRERRLRQQRRVCGRYAA